MLDTFFDSLLIHIYGVFFWFITVSTAVINSTQLVDQFPFHYLLPLRRSPYNVCKSPNLINFHIHIDQFLLFNFEYLNIIFLLGRLNICVLFFYIPVGILSHHKWNRPFQIFSAQRLLPTKKRRSCKSFRTKQVFKVH